MAALKMEYYSELLWAGCKVASGLDWNFEMAHSNAGTYRGVPHPL